MALCSHRPFNLTFGYSQILKEFFAYMWFKIWNNLHTPNARWPTYFDLRTLTWEFVEMLTYWVVPIQVITQASHSFNIWIWLVKGLFQWIKHGIFLCIISSIAKIWRSQGLFVLNVSPCYSSSPMFQDPTVKSHFDLKTCPWKFHNQHWVKCNQNNPFMGLGS